MPDRTCAQCGKPVSRKRNTYCSLACSSQAQRARISVTCPCGTVFETTAARIADGRGKLCSEACRHRYYTRRSGLTYDIKVVNKAWFPPQENHQTPEEKAACKRQWKHRNLDKVRAQGRRQYAKSPPTPEQTYQRWLQSKHGMTPDDFLAMVEAQDGRCYLCGDVLQLERTGRARQVCIEHSHACCPTQKSCAGCRRGLSCPKCNFVLGLVSDDPDRLRRIASNLEAAMNHLALAG